MSWERIIMSTNPPAGGGNNSQFGQRRDGRLHAPNMFSGTNTGALPQLNPVRNYGTGGFDFDEMIMSLRELFEQDRQAASQNESKRCGICYLYFAPVELLYREEEGFYVCASCTRSLGKQNLNMIRRQQK
jgi:hypothetical protein